MENNFKFAICTNCGSELKLDTTKKSSFCAACGSKINVNEAVRRFEVLFPARAQEEAVKEQMVSVAAAEATVAPPAASTAELVAAIDNPPEPVVDDDENSLPNLYIRAKEFLGLRDYLKAADIYTKIVTEIDTREHAAHWGLFLVDERNFNTEEKLLQCFSCFPFRAGAESIRREILSNQNLDKALHNAPPDERKYYNEEVVKYSENIYNLYREGVEGLTAISEHRYDMLNSTFETVGITSLASRIGYPAGVSVKFISDKMYIQFQTNRLNMLHMDVLYVNGQPTPTYEFWHYRHVLMNNENGSLSWSEFRIFKNCNELGEIAGELDTFHKIGFVLLGVWRDKLIVRTGNKVFFCCVAAQPENIQQIFRRCYSTVCVPVVEDPNSWNTGHKSSEFYQIQPISANFDTAKKSRWVRKGGPGGCYIATAVYGDYDAPQVLKLRRFRDEVLMNSALGRAFVRVYYKLSPPVAKRLGADSTVTRLVRRALDWFVRRV